MIRRPPRSTRTDTLFPYPTLFRSGRSLSQMRIGRNHGLQSPLVRAVPAVLVGMIAPDPLRIGPADVVQAGAGVQPQHLQGLAILAGKHLSVARNRLLHRRTGESRAQYIRRIGKARPCRFRIAIGGEDSRFPFPPGKGALRGLDLVGRHALEIIIARVEGADMIEAEPAPAIGRWPRARSEEPTSELQSLMRI